MNKRCELCSSPARMYCESDGASLCWDCDAKVHSANFLVAKHSRCLLCHLCQSLTPWLASGTDLGRTVSVCVTCAASNNLHRKQHDAAAAQSQPEIVGRNIAQHDRSEDTDEDDDEVSDSEGEHSSDDEEGENQVVPWSCSPLLPHTGTSFSSSEDLSSCTLSPRGISSVLKYCVDIDVAGLEENDTDCCSSILHTEDAATPDQVTSSPAAAEAQEASSLIRSDYRPRKVIQQESVVTRTEVVEEEMVRTRKRFKQSTGVNDDKVSNADGYVWDMQK